MTAAVRVPQGGADVSYKTARQVRYSTPRSHNIIHQVKWAKFGQDIGYVYRARCGEVLSATAGAMRTTREADCERCRRG